jgi:hypothetical protein
MSRHIHFGNGPERCEHRQIPQKVVRRPVQQMTRANTIGIGELDASEVNRQRRRELASNMRDDDEYRNQHCDWYLQ